MSTVLPKTNVEKIQFCEQHVATWTSNAVAMGSSASAITAWSAQVSAARAAFNAQKVAQDAAKDATITYKQALEAMTASTADIIKAVKAKAAVSGDSIYVLASIPVPATPAPKPAPGKPSNLVVLLGETGVLDLAWKCVNPPGTAGTLYQVWRQIGEAGDLVYLGGAGEKKFTDDTLPAGSMNVMYQIQAVRSTAVGEFATFNVRFGVSTGGAVTATVTDGPVKMAA
jgi:hypothetical protein